MKPKIVIVGAGGHAKVVCDTIMHLNIYKIVGFVDIAKSDNQNRAIDSLFYLDLKIIANQDSLENLRNVCEYFIVAIGDNFLRFELFNNLKKFLKPYILIHPMAIVSATATIGDGSVILANAIVNSNSIIGNNCIINSGVIIDNDCKIGNNVYLRIGTLVGNNTEIKEFSSSRMGEIIIPHSII
jgi:sugar O-acyltransferase (sialic acid O-acetyltransferase NeuD family)